MGHKGIVKSIRYFPAVSGVLLVCALCGRAEPPTTQPFAGLTCRHEVRADPPMRLYVADLDLTNPRGRLRVSPGGPDPDGPDRWETTLMTPTSVAAREGFALVVNGDFFTIPKPQERPSAPPGYRTGVWASAVGPAVTDGKVWSTSSDKTPCLVVRKNRRITIEMVNRPPADALEVLAGNVMLVEDGKAVPHTNEARHPRTVVGLDKGGRKLTILVVDGRRPGVSIGMSYAELAREMLRLGCHWALNLDGGGSSVMALRDPASGEYRIINQPSDGRERPVANVLGILLEAGRH